MRFITATTTVTVMVTVMVTAALSSPLYPDGHRKRQLDELTCDNTDCNTDVSLSAWLWNIKGPNIASVLHKVMGLATVRPC
jgi:hypothetical protein